MSYQVRKVRSPPAGTLIALLVVSLTSRLLPSFEYHSVAPSLPLRAIACLAGVNAILTPVVVAEPLAAGCSFTVAVAPRLTTFGRTKPSSVLSSTFIGAGLVPMPHSRPSQEPLAMIVQKPALASPVVLS